MTNGPETVDKWIIGVVNHDGSLHLVRCMPWAAMWATKFKVYLGSFEKNLQVLTPAKHFYSKCTATFESA
jgi:hypothetical protein